MARITLSKLLDGHTHLSADMAIRLELAFGKSAESWLAHQAAYDIWQKQASMQTLGIKA